MASSDFLQKQTKLASICISELQGQNWSIPYFRDFMTHLSHCTSLRTLKLRGLTVLSDAQTFEELVGLIPYLTELDLSWSVFKYSQFDELGQCFRRKNALRSVALDGISLQDMTNDKKK